MSTNGPASRATVYGYPRQGDNRELKKATEAYWADTSDPERLLATTRRCAGSVSSCCGTPGSRRSRATTSRFTTMCSIRPSCWARFRRGTARQSRT